MSTLADFAPATADADGERCAHDMRDLDEDPFCCFECWMAERPGTTFPRDDNAEGDA